MNTESSAQAYLDLVVTEDIGDYKDYRQNALEQIRRLRSGLDDAEEMIEANLPPLPTGEITSTAQLLEFSLLRLQKVHRTLALLRVDPLHPTPSIATWPMGSTNERLLGLLATLFRWWFAFARARYLSVHGQGEAAALGQSYIDGLRTQAIGKAIDLQMHQDLMQETFRGRNEM